jgi:hypothetical protein
VKIFSVISGILVLFAMIPYIRAIMRKETKPAKASWLIWAIADTIILSGMIAKHANYGQMLGVTLGTWIMVILAFKYGAKGWTKLDKFCLVSAALGILLSRINPIFGIIAGLSVIAIGSIPTLVSAWKHPEHENKLAWTIIWLSSVCAVIAIPKWIIAETAQPITFITLQSGMMYILFIHGRSSLKHETKEKIDAPALR